MKKKMTGKIFSDSGIKMSLLDILDFIPENDWQWAIYEFDAIGLAPDGMTMPEFEDLVLSIDHGFNITWASLKKLAKSTTDINSCILAAVTKPTSYSFITENVDQPLALVIISDSTTWEVIVNQKEIERISSMRFLCTLQKTGR